MHYEVAPLEGITTWIFRGTHKRIFGGANKYYMPFFSPTMEHNLTAKELRELLPEQNIGVLAVPQILTRRAEDFLWAAERLRELGYDEVNLNLGCPSGTVTAKGKGSALLSHPDELDAFLNEIYSKTPLPVTVKTRLGFREATEFPRLLEIFNRYPIKELIVHPRVREAFYKGTVQLDSFKYALENSRSPVTYNGDLVTQADCTAFSADFPAVDTVMLGRGVVADPALLRKIHGGSAAKIEELREFTQTIYQGYRTAYDYPLAAAQRMKQLWIYLIRLFADGDSHEKKMRRVTAPGEYERLETEIFRDLELLTEAKKPL